MRRKDAPRVSHCLKCGSDLSLLPRKARYPERRYCSVACYGHLPKMWTLEEFLLELVPNGECLEWPHLCAKKPPQNYGLTAHNKKAVLTHRLVFTLKYGPIPPGMLVLHSCDNPPCCNLAHLRLGTDRDNADDRIARGRSKGRCQVGERNWRARLSEEEAMEILLSTEPRSVLAQRYGVGLTQISNIKCDYGWKHLRRPVVEGRAQ